MSTRRPGFGYCCICGTRDMLDVIRSGQGRCSACQTGRRPPESSSSVKTPLPDALYREDLEDALEVLAQAGLTLDAREAFYGMASPVSANPAGIWICSDCGSKLVICETEVSKTADGKLMPGWRTALAERISAPCRSCLKTGTASLAAPVVQR